MGLANMVPRRSNKKHGLSNFALVKSLDYMYILICQFILSTFHTYEMAKCCLAEVPPDLILLDL